MYGQRYDTDEQYGRWYVEQQYAVYGNDQCNNGSVQGPFIGHEHDYVSYVHRLSEHSSSYGKCESGYDSGNLAGMYRIDEHINEQCKRWYMEQQQYVSRNDSVGHGSSNGSRQWHNSDQLYNGRRLQCYEDGNGEQCV